jgi:adenylate cyclase
VSKAQRRAAQQSIAVGVAVTAVVALLLAAGWLDWLELKTLDFRFRYANSAPQHPDLVCLDIDDAAIGTVGRWPWSRDVQAGVYSVLAESGLKRLLVDVTYGEAQTFQTIPPRYADVLTDPLGLVLEQPDVVTIALPDLELRAAVQDVGNVYLAYDYAAATERANELPRQVRAWFEADPSRWLLPRSEAFERLFDEVAHSDGKLHFPLAQALAEALSYRATTARLPVPIQPALAPYVPEVGQVSPVYFLHAEVATRCGFVAFDPDGDGIVRRMRLMVQHNGKLLPQLAFAVAFDELGLKAEDIGFIAGGRALRLRGGANPLVVQLDSHGNAFVPWVSETDWTRQYGPRVPIGVAHLVWSRRQDRLLNERLIAAALETLARDGLLAHQGQYLDDLRTRLKLDDDLRLARLRGDRKRAAELAALAAQAEALLREGDAALHASLEELRSASEQRAAVLATLADVERARTANAAFERDIDAALDFLRERLKGRIGLLGYTATSLADMSPFPTHPRAPGVLAHANLLNGLLTGRMLAWAPLWLNLAFTVAFGVLTSLVSVLVGPRSVFVLAATLAAFLTFAGWYAFYYHLYWFALVAPTLALAFSYFAIVIYRYYFLEREQRQLAKVLGQYTSATLARRMAEDPELCKRAETRPVTAMFTDLAGFTTISEAIGAERTQRVLNVTLGRLSDAILRHEGMINKFIGDGIFAFWNPVIYPQPDHARRACEGALDLMAALARLIDEQRGRGDEAFGNLYLRVGVATGNAVVGPCGSEQKYDYTCIGDSVNVAARLESANKFYGTRILVSGATLDAAGEGFEARSLGRVQVKGKTQGVPIFELLGRRGGVDDGVRRYAEQFAAAVAMFQRREFTTALDAFGTCFQLRPDDQAAQRYIDATCNLIADPPRENWNGAIELSEK